MKERSVHGSLQRTMTNVVLNNIDFRESTILNCQDFSQSKLEGLFTGSIVTSDADAQLLVKIKFREKVDCSQIKFCPLPESLESQKPRTVKLFVNKNEMDFGDVDTMVSATVIEFPFENADFTQSLAGAKFTRIQSLQIFVEVNFGTDQTCLGPIQIDGFISPSYHTQ